MKKHAFIIMAHDNFYCLETLIKLLDDPRNDIFLHIDSKVNDFDFHHFGNMCKQANLIYPSRRINVCWGTQSQVITEMLMLETALNHGPYHYYHILSGSDLPLRSQDAIHEWFSKKTDSYLNYSDQTSKWDIQRLSRYHFKFRKKNALSTKLNGLIGMIQEQLHIDRIKNTGLIVRKGSNWASLTQEAVELLLANKSIIMKLTRFSVCADEVYKQTILLHNHLPVIRNDLRMIIWKDGNHPHTYVAADYDLLCSSDRLFARKFSDKVDRQIIDMIYNRIRGAS